MARPVMRIIVVWVFTAGTLLALGALLSDVEVKDVGAAFGSAALIGLLNALLWPTVIRLALPITVLTVGLFAIVLNGVMVLLVSAIAPGLDIHGLFAGVVVALAITVVNTAVTSLLAIDDDALWVRNVVRRQARKVAGTVETDVPGLFFLEIDGLAHDVLTRAMRDGNAPNMARWVRGGTHNMLGWETDWSSQTGACQAGLLHGDNFDMPAFRWWEKDRGAPIVTNHPRDAMELERRHSNGRGLLFDNGASRANIVSGDAVHSLLTMSTVLRRDRPGKIGQDYFAYFAAPYNVFRTIALMTREVVSELTSAAQQRRLNVEPRIKRGFVYSLVRAWATVIQLDLQVSAIVSDIYAGLPVAYTTFLAYDEVAHHSGIEREDTLKVLRRVDRQIGRIAAAAEHAPRPYKFVVLSDHGQSQGATFLDRFGVSLEELVTKACSAEQQTEARTERSDEALAFLSASVTEAASGDSPMAKALRRTRTPDPAPRSPDPASEIRDPRSEILDPSSESLPEISVMASGCLGLISFPREPGRVTLERIEALYPNLLPALMSHPGIGFVLVRSQVLGALAMSARGVHHLDSEQVDGEDPLAPFGPNAARHVKRTDSYPHCPDIVLNSTYWEDTDEVAAFEELVGSHGGMGGSQSYPFLLHPIELEPPGEPLVGAEAVHRRLRAWLVDLGHDGYREPAAERPAELAERSI